MSTDLSDYVVLTPTQVHYVQLALNPNLMFKRDDLIWCLYSKKMQESVLILDYLFQQVRHCEECYFILKEERDMAFLFKHMQEIHDNPNTAVLI